jgi:hypothetical protein
MSSQSASTSRLDVNGNLLHGQFGSEPTRRELEAITLLVALQ